MFAIGQGVHHWTQSGGELTITNSNSNFGLVSALSEGYNESIPQDHRFTATHLRVPSDLRDKKNNIRRIYLGTIDSVSGTAITLDTALTAGANNAPEELGDYTFAADSYLWIESPITADYRAKVAASAWATGTPKVINVQTSPVTDSTDGKKAPGDNIVVGGTDTGVDYPAFKGLRVYVRRLIDTRSEDERRYALLMDQLATSRILQRDYILRTNDNTVGNASYTDVAVLKAGRTTLTAQQLIKLKLSSSRLTLMQVSKLILFTALVIRLLLPTSTTSARNSYFRFSCNRCWVPCEL